VHAVGGFQGCIDEMRENDGGSDAGLQKIMPHRSVA
jgi:hypothetical protein